MLHKDKLIALCIAKESGQYGVPYSAEDYDASKYRYLRITDIADDGRLLDNDLKSVSGENLESYLLSDNDIVFARTGNSTGRSYLYDKRHGDLVYAGFLIRYKIDENKINPKYLRYFTNSNYYKQWVNNLSNGSTRGNINAQTFADCDIVYPDRSQQETLVNTLSCIDEKIALNTRMNAELEAMAKQLYDYWFVQFDFPDENGKPYKSSGGKMVYNPTLKREIPAGWENKTLGEISKTPKESIAPFDTPNKIFKHYSIPAYDIYGSYSLDRGDEIQSSKFVVHNGQILAPKLNPWYNRIIMVNSDENAICSTEYVILEPKEDYVRGFIFYTVKTDGFITFCSKGSTGTSHSQRRVPPEILRGFSFPFNADVVSDFTKCVMSQINILNRNLEQNRQLSILRDSLLPMLMNGQVTVE